jgi:hypothetical protein
MSITDHNRAVLLCADTIAKIAVRLSAAPCDSPAQRARFIYWLDVISEEIRTLKIELGEKANK